MTTSSLAYALGPSLLGRVLDQPRENPDFAITHEQVALEMERMRATPVAAPRPVLVLAGYHAWSLTVGSTARTLRSLVGGPEEHFHAIAYPLSFDIESIARRVVVEVDRRWPGETADRHVTREIDVIGVSMGGLVARLAAQLPLHSGQKRLRIARLFTLGTPHRGAILSERLPGFLRDRAASQMKPGSAFLDRLNSGLPTAKYELVCYARLNDRWVGASRCAPPGRNPIWVSGIRVLSHTTITSDLRIVADVARRLRGEVPLAKGDSMPPSD